MLIVEGSIEIDRTPDVILDWIGDLERYRRADRKIASVRSQSPGRVRYRGRLRGLPTPLDEQTIERTGTSLVLRGAPRWTRRFLDFEGGFWCESSPRGATLVVHRESLGFKPAPLRWVAEAWLRRWMAADVLDEVARLKLLVEAETPDDGEERSSP